MLSIKLSRLLVSMTVIQAGSWLLLLLLFFSSFLVVSRQSVVFLCIFSLSTILYSSLLLFIFLRTQSRFGKVAFRAHPAHLSPN